jgi:HEAT repeat protein
MVRTINDLLAQLQGGTVVSDGAANTVADLVLAEPPQLDKLVEGLRFSDDVIRARSAHALERISRRRPDLVVKFLPEFIDLAINDPVPMVRWHIPMIFSNLTLEGYDFEIVLSILFRLLHDNSVFVKNWTISGLAILGQQKKVRRAEIVRYLKTMAADPSRSVRVRADKAIRVLENNLPVPAGWYKVEQSPDSGRD